MGPEYTLEKLSKKKENKLPVATRPGAILVRATINFCIRIPEFDCDVLFQFVFEFHSMNTRNRLHKSRLSVGYMSNRSNVDCCLP